MRMTARRSQVDALLAYLRKHPEGIERKAAEKELGICSLSRRVCDLIGRGEKVGKRRKKVPSRYARATYVVVYYLEKKKEDKAEAPAATADDRSPDKDDRPAPALSVSPRRFSDPRRDKTGQQRFFGSGQQKFFG